MATNNAINQPLLNTTLIASNGGILYSSDVSVEILEATDTGFRILMSGANTAPSWSTAIYPTITTINQILYSSAANTVTGLATANNAVLVTDGSGVPSLNTSSQLLLSVDQTTSSITMTPNRAYIINNGASLVTLTLPAIAAIGTVIKIVGRSSGMWTIAQQVSQNIIIGAVSTTPGVAGSLSATNASDCVEIVNTNANMTWVVASHEGTLTPV